MSSKNSPTLTKCSPDKPFSPFACLSSSTGTHPFFSADHCHRKVPFAFALRELACGRRDGSRTQTRFCCLFVWCVFLAGGCRLIVGCVPWCVLVRVNPSPHTLPPSLPRLFLHPFLFPTVFLHFVSFLTSDLFHIDIRTDVHHIHLHLYIHLQTHTLQVNDICCL